MAAPLGGAAQLAQEPPQLFTLALETHVPPQAWNPALQVTEQVDATAG